MNGEIKEGMKCIFAANAVWEIVCAKDVLYNII